MTDYLIFGIIGTGCLAAFFAGGCCALMIAYVLTPSSDYEEEDE